MRITESKLRQLIKETLIREDLQGFINATSDIRYTGDYRDPTFDGEHNKSLNIKQKARQIKQAWSLEADHDFMNEVIKIHWIKQENVRENLKKVLNTSRMNEISTMGYLPGSPDFKSTWGPIGVVIQGRTTLAANHMSAIFSGYAGRLDPEVTAKYEKTGIPRRPTAFWGGKNPENSRSQEYILDRKSFKPQQQGQNEFIVANWKPIGIVFSQEFTDYMIDTLMGDLPAQIEPGNSAVRAFIDSGLPALDKNDEMYAQHWVKIVDGHKDVKEKP